MGTIDNATLEVGPDSATFPLPGNGGWLLRKKPLSGRLIYPRSLASDELTHPALASAATVLNYWLGREVFHGGAVLIDNEAWGLLGTKEAGKSTLLALLSQLGAGIVADDMTVVEMGEEIVVLAGPRCIDLRLDVAPHFEGLSLARRQRRMRLFVNEIPPACPLRGWISLTVGDDVVVEKIPPSQRLARLVPNKMMGAYLTPNPQTFLRLLALSFLEFRRPLTWEDSSKSAELLLNALTSP